MKKPKTVIRYNDLSKVIYPMSKQYFFKILVTFAGIPDNNLILIQSLRKVVTP
jgi:hypothetical protein